MVVVEFRLESYQDSNGVGVFSKIKELIISQGLR